jgi:hypothetical protein
VCALVMFGLCSGSSRRSHTLLIHSHSPSYHCCHVIFTLRTHTHASTHAPTHTPYTSHSCTSHSCTQSFCLLPFHRCPPPLSPSLPPCASFALGPGVYGEGLVWLPAAYCARLRACARVWVVMCLVRVSPCLPPRGGVCGAVAWLSCVCPPASHLVAVSVVAVS